MQRTNLDNVLIAPSLKFSKLRLALGVKDQGWLSRLAERLQSEGEYVTEVEVQWYHMIDK